MWEENKNRTYIWVYILAIVKKKNMRKEKEGNRRRERGQDRLKRHKEIKMARQRRADIK